MSYQDRVDIDRIYDDFYDYQYNTKVVTFKEGSLYRSVSLNDDDDGTIDGIISYFGLDTVSNNVSELNSRLDEFMNNLYDMIYPIGTLYQTTDSDFDPNDSFSGEWENIEDNEIYVWERVIETE